MILQTELHTVYEPQRHHHRPPRSKGLKPTFKAIILWHLAALCFHLCHSLCSGETSIANSHELVDLSYEFNNETIYWITTKPLVVNTTHNGTERGFWYHIEDFSAGTHGGTHMDAPCHFVQGRWCVSDIPVRKLVAPAAVIDISHHVKDDPNVHLTADHLKEWEADHGQVPDGSVVLIRTGWSRFWPDRESYTGTTEKDVSLLKFPSVNPEAAQWIVDNRNIIGFGIDTISLDRPNLPEPRSHQILEDKNIYGIENVNDNLKLLPATGATVFVMPMKLKDASGAPCRVLALIPKPTTSGAKCRADTCSLVVFLATLFSLYVIWSGSIPRLI